jgi:hypothetical protein
MNLRFAIYDLRAALPKERRVELYATRKSYIVNRKFPAATQE